MQQAPTFPTIPHSRAGKITDRILDQIEDATRRIQLGETLSSGEASLILMCAPQICHELRQRRAAMELICDVTDLDNIRFMPAREG